MAGIAYLQQQTTSQILYIVLESGLGHVLLEETDEMPDQVEIGIPITVVPEETTFTVTTHHRTRSTKAGAIPTTIHYRVDCLTTKRQITDWTAVSTPAASNSIVITATENQILEDGNNRETKQITIKLDDGLTTQVMKPKRWIVENLLGTT